MGGTEAQRRLEQKMSPEIDSTALLTEPTLRAWGIPFRRCTSDDDPVSAILDTVVAAREDRRPSALILLRALN